MRGINVRRVTHDLRTPDLFADVAPAPGSLGCAAEVAAVMREALDRLQAEHGMTREDVALGMSRLLGDKFSAATLNGYCANSHEDREPSFRRAMAFDAICQQPILLGLYVRKLGLGKLITDEDAELLEWAKLHLEERRIAERKRALAAAMKLRGAR